MLEMSAEHSDNVQEDLIYENKNLEMTAEHADMIEAELEEKKQQIRDPFCSYVSSQIVSAILDYAIINLVLFLSFLYKNTICVPV